MKIVYIQGVQCDVYSLQNDYQIKFFNTFITSHNYFIYLFIYGKNTKDLLS